MNQTSQKGLLLQPPSIFQVSQKPVFQAPQPNFQAPQPNFQAPQPNFQAPQQSIFQQPNFQAPQQPNFQAPQQPIFQAPQQPIFQAPQQPIFQAPQQPIFQAPQQPNFQQQHTPQQQPMQQPIFQAPQPVFQAPQPVFQAPQPVFQAPPKKNRLVYIMLGDEIDTVHLGNVKALIEMIKSHNEPFVLLMKEHQKYDTKFLVDMLSKEVGEERIRAAMSYPALLAERFRDFRCRDLLVESVVSRLFVENVFYEGEIFNMVVVASCYSVATVSYVFHAIFQEHTRVILNVAPGALTNEALTQKYQRLQSEQIYLGRLLNKLVLCNGCIFSYWNSLATSLIFVPNQSDKEKVSDYKLYLRSN